MSWRWDHVIVFLPWCPLHWLLLYPPGTASDVICHPCLVSLRETCHCSWLLYSLPELLTAPLFHLHSLCLPIHRPSPAIIHRCWNGQAQRHFQNLSIRGQVCIFSHWSLWTIACYHWGGRPFHVIFHQDDVSPTINYIWIYRIWDCQVLCLYSEYPHKIRILPGSKRFYEISFAAFLWHCFPGAIPSSQGLQDWHYSKLSFSVVLHSRCLIIVVAYS